jgi:site-specific DNA recombinase
LVRPGLEGLRDLAAEGQIQAVLIYSPDRLSRKYAYQVLLAEELARCGVELVFLRAPSGATPEDQLLVQFQGMIAEYERAQIAERSRRGKRHRAQQGSINVLSGAPYGYRYVKKTDTSAAYYEVVESEAEVVRLIFDAYTRQGLSIGAIAGLLNQREVPTRTRHGRWERPTIWKMLHNPAYAGHAFYGKTELRPRQRITRRLRQRGLCSRDSSFRERPHHEWIEIPVPALVSEATFALAQEQFEKNKRFSPRRTIEPSLLQGLLVCQRCGYGLYRASTRTSQRTIYYYRCLGRDNYRHLKGAVCDNKPIRQEELDAVVWEEIVRLLEDPSLLQAELDRRLQAAHATDPLKRREDALRRDQARLTNSMERLLTGYQENLITLEELRCRMPELRKQQRAIEAELHSLEMAAVDPTRNLRLLETLSQFRTRLRARSNVLEVAERQRVVRLLVQEVLVGRDNITIRHSIPMPASSPDSNHGVHPSPELPEPNTGSHYLLRSHSLHSGAGQALEELLPAGQPGNRRRRAAQLRDHARQTEQWREQQLSSATAKLIIYRAFFESDLQAPKHLAGVVHDLYFNPKYEQFQPRTMAFQESITAAPGTPRSQLTAAGVEAPYGNYFVLSGMRAKRPERNGAPPANRSTFTQQHPHC